MGGELIRRLDSSTYQIRALVRDPNKMRPSGNKLIETYKGDLLFFETIQKAFVGVDVAFYLAHSMDSKKEFERLECDTATNFARAAAESGVKRIIYLGALGLDDEGTLSSHLKSRKRVGNILRSSGIQIIEFQASIILGAGSLSYEMIKALSERLPVMIMPRWVSVKAQPIATTDVLEYLTQAIELKVDGNKIFEIGGPDQVSYKELIQEYCRQCSLQRLLIPVPVLTPWLSSLWLALVTPTFACVGKKLILSIKNPTVVKESSALRTFNTIKPMKVSEAIAIALKKNKEPGGYRLRFVNQTDL